MLLDATKPQDGVNGNAEGVHSAEGGDSGRATGSEVESVPAPDHMILTTAHSGVVCYP